MYRTNVVIELCSWKVYLPYYCVSTRNYLLKNFCKHNIKIFNIRDIFLNFNQKNSQPFIW